MQNNLWNTLRRLSGQVGADLAYTNAKADEPLIEAFGVPAVIADAALTYSFCNAALAVHIARLWRSSAPVARLLDFALLFPARSALTVLILSVWLCVMSRWFGYVKWPRWWAIPYVLLISCPLAWVFASPSTPDGNYFPLFLVQCPLIILLVWKAHIRAKQQRDRR